MPRRLPKLIPEPISAVTYPCQRDSRERVRGFVFFARHRSLLSLNYFRLAVTVNVAQRMAYWSLLRFFAAYLIQAHDVSLGFVALPLVISALGQVVRSYAAGLVATKSYRVALMAVSSSSGGVCAFLFFVVDFGLWPAVAGGYGGIGPVEHYHPGAVGGQHGAFRGIQGHWRQSHRFQQPDRRSASSVSEECRLWWIQVGTNREQLPVIAGRRRGCRRYLANGVPMMAETGFVNYATSPWAGNLAPKRNSLSRLWPVQISSHSLCTFSRPRSRNCRNPRPCLIWPNTGSTVAIRSA